MHRYGSSKEIPQSWYVTALSRGITRAQNPVQYLHLQGQKPSVS